MEWNAERVITSAVSCAALILCAALHLVACNSGSVIEAAAPWGKDYKTVVMNDLGSLGGTSQGYGINASGNVTGASYLSSANPHGGGMHAFRYVDGLGMIDVGVLPSAIISEGNGINSAGLIVGASLIFVDNDVVSHAFLASVTLTLTDLGTLGGDYSYAFDINDRGQVTGEASIKSGDSHAFLWTVSRGMRDIGTLGGNTSVGRSINESGQVAGESKVGSGPTIRAFRFSEGAGMVSLGTLSGGSNSSAYGINNNGQVVGESDTEPIANRSFRQKGLALFGTHAFLWMEGVGMTDLGHLGGGESTATAVSNNGVVVGTSTLIDGAPRAFRWNRAGGMIDLNVFLPRNSGWVLQYANDVNDNGQITGGGRHNGVYRAFRLNPPRRPDTRWRD